MSGPGRKMPLVTAAAAVTIGLIGAGLTPGVAAATTRTAGTASARASQIPPPVARGALRIRGQLRDGRVVHASGLSWRPGQLRSGERLLSFEVSYSWRACTARRGRCVRGADRTATPFAARRYIVGHADTGKYLRVNETAAEVVETNPADFTFKIIRQFASYTTHATVRAFRRGQRPGTEFVNGLPEHRTGST